MNFSGTMIALALTPTITGAAFGATAVEAPRSSSPTAIVIFGSAKKSTEWVIDQSDGDKSVDRRDSLRNQADVFMALQDGWDGPHSRTPFEASYNSAVKFIERLPGGISLPGIMASPEGEIGFYWKLDGGYADISFDENGLASFYSETTGGIEVFLEDLEMASFDRVWFFEHLGAMDSPLLQAA